MAKFKKFYKRLMQKRKGKAKASFPSSINKQNYTNAVNYVNTPPYGNPPSVGGFTDSSFPGYPSN